MKTSEMMALVKVRGWRLSKQKGWVIADRCWYIEDENGEVVVSHRKTRNLTLQWAVALITGDEEKQDHLRLIESTDGFVSMYDEWKKSKGETNGQ